ncbi:hypothetical protein C2845_PM03G29360 [Panicum miliaceum]|uniref:Uncharacterized protein n=1 Tax=Panicum miliaceum TaxID=4540 RepID=A0A3L6T3K4_PANMI|nr:hypothetical protein C2845_PM03G29360 [Panicum miliaceum]
MPAAGPSSASEERRRTAPYDDDNDAQDSVNAACRVRVVPPQEEEPDHQGSGPRQWKSDHKFRSHGIGSDDADGLGTLQVRQNPIPLQNKNQGLGLALYTMSSFLVAAVPYQDRSSTAINPPVMPPKQAQWAAPMLKLQERITEEWRRREKKGSSSLAPMAGLLAEMQAVERAARFAEEEHGIVSEERAREVTERTEELAACQALEDRLAPLARQVPAVFRRVMACRGEVVRCIDHSSHTATANAGTSASSMPPQHQHSF